MRIVAALGGNALLQRGDPPDADVQLHHVEQAAAALAPLTTQHELVVCHGNGPQVGLLARESESDPALRVGYPLDALGAQTQGMVGYWLTQELGNAGVTAPVACVVTRTLVDGADPAFQHPTKFIGPQYTQAEAAQLAGERGWSVAADGSSWRRVVASPQPLDVLESGVVRTLLGDGVVTICLGGGGAPVQRDADGRLRGADAVVDKDLSAALLAVLLDADALLLLTDVSAVQEHFGTPGARPLARLEVDRIPDLELPAGSMGPKVEACRRFVVATGRTAAIGTLTEAAAVLAGSAGTTVTGRYRAPRHRSGRP